jgi:hypothetical protein
LTEVRLDNNDPTLCEVVDGKLLCGEEEYIVETSGDTFLLTELDITENGYTSVVMKKDNYCIIKRENEEEYTYKKIVDKVNNSEIEITENNCSLDPSTSENCFAFDSTTGTITKYYGRENNESKGTVCPRDVIIPKKIRGVEVKVIGTNAFLQNNLTSVTIPNSVTVIGQQAFMGNKLMTLAIPEGVTTLGNHAFGWNGITTLTLPSTLISMGTGAFVGNKLSQENAYFYKRNSDGSIDYSTIIGYGGSSAEGGKDIIIPSEKNVVTQIEMAEKKHNKPIYVHQTGSIKVVSAQTSAVKTFTESEVNKSFPVVETLLD